MPDPLVNLLLGLFPEEYRERYSPQIQADLYRPGANRIVAVSGILWNALLHLLLSPAPYVWIGAFLLAGSVIAVSIPLFAALVLTLLPRPLDAPEALWAMMFFGVFFAVFATVLVATHWLQIFRGWKYPRRSRLRI
jgi:hypothetical protein